MNYAVVYLAAIIFFSTAYYLIAGRKWYTGPLIEADINEDESMQAERSSDEGINQKTEKHGQVIQ